MVLLHLFQVTLQSLRQHTGNYQEIQKIPTKTMLLTMLFVRHYRSFWLVNQEVDDQHLQ
jgi:hypothetical protein